jgi:hypothetical protein
MSSTCIVTEMYFQGATQKTVIHIIPGKEPIFLLRTDVTKPMGCYPQWELATAKDKSVNGIFKTRDDKNERIYMSHTHQDQRNAFEIANMLARHYVTKETTIPLFLHHAQGDLWPKVKAPEYFAAALQNQLWTVTPRNGGTSFPIEGDELCEGLSFPGKEIVGEINRNGGCLELCVPYHGTRSRQCG